jgi:hypothetical protein
MNMAEDRPQGSAVVVGTGVKVGVKDGVREGGTIAVLVAGAVDASPGVTLPPGTAQPAKRDKSKSQEMSFTF